VTEILTLLLLNQLAFLAILWKLDRG